MKEELKRKKDKINGLADFKLEMKENDKSRKLNRESENLK